MLSVAFDYCRSRAVCAKTQTRRSETSGLAHREELDPQHSTWLCADQPLPGPRRTTILDVFRRRVAGRIRTVGQEKGVSPPRVTWRADVIEKNCPQRSLWLRHVQPLLRGDRTGEIRKPRRTRLDAGRAKRSEPAGQDPAGPLAS